ncbi:hypothetical protein F4009_18505 [Candidatus Poribacteria bacterium]|nr:hypothetical protein [Candidatus Poribacteria bacterium]MYK95960.1 hypothetical protein [Candidatus Poribacteria bacterium]
MSVKIISQEKDPVADMFWVFAIHYQILLMLKLDVDINVDDLNAGVKTTVPDRSIPEEAYSPANVSKPTYTLADLLAQITENNLHDEVDTGPAVGNEV